MGIQKDKLIYDGTTPADGDSVAAFLHASGGKLTSTNVSGKEGLDVNIVNAIEVDVDHATDSVKVGDGTDFLGVNADGSINVVATATDLDIRNLSDASDSVAAVQSGTWTVTATATDLDIRDLSDTQDSVRAKDTAETFLNTAKVVSTTGVVVASALTGRRRILFQNQGSKAVYVGPSGVSNANGIKVSAGANIEIPLGAGAALHAVAESGSQNCVIMEMA